MEINTKYQNLKETIKSLESVLVAFSGGVDSALLLKTCVDVLGREHVKAVINASPIHPGKEIEEA
ncbi:MAG TPA: TIGR00268 family protein, partial [Deltaproteobacteria bacterium]|nr:TIGR00268 family protein [Deltaproteobacteria bacterium]